MKPICFVSALLAFTCVSGWAMAESSQVKIAQLRGVPVKWDIDANLATFVAQAEAAGALKPDIFITPECWLDGYAAPDQASTRERLMGVAQPLSGSPYLEKVAELAKKHRMWICFGFSSLEEGKLFNTSGLWNREGELVGVYHKTHIQTHDTQYDLGMGLPVWESEWGKLGMMICADRRWPETVRTLRLQGARLILNPTYGMHNALNLKIMQVRAWENQCFIAFTHPSQSLVVNPKGDVVLNEEGDSPAFSIVTVDLGEAKDDNHLRDRRPELYGELSRGSAPAAAAP